MRFDTSALAFAAMAFPAVSALPAPHSRNPSAATMEMAEHFHSVHANIPVQIAAPEVNILPEDATWEERTARVPRGHIYRLSKSTSKVYEIAEAELKPAKSKRGLRGDRNQEAFFRQNPPVKMKLQITPASYSFRSGVLLPTVRPGIDDIQVPTSTLGSASATATAEISHSPSNNTAPSRELGTEGSIIPSKTSIPVLPSGHGLSNTTEKRSLRSSDGNFRLSEKSKLASNSASKGQEKIVDMQQWGRAAQTEVKDHIGKRWDPYYALHAKEDDESIK